MDTNWFMNDKRFQDDNDALAEIEKLVITMDELQFNKFMWLVNKEWKLHDNSKAEMHIQGALRLAKRLLNENTD